MAGQRAALKLVREKGIDYAERSSQRLRSWLGAGRLRSASSKRDGSGGPLKMTGDATRTRAAEAIWLVIDGFSRIGGAAAVALVQELGLLL